MLAVRREFPVELKEVFPVAWLAVLSAESSAICRRRHHHQLHRQLPSRENRSAWAVS
jgi:hypothetical protein